ncbi:MAG TPA: hypothetical protein VLA76_04985 [Candidatus Angelobacter sp.]|nr:hypothetical protein [Candidatus Angelobacter sp.]
MTVADRLRRFGQAVRTRPQVALVTAVVALAAILAGGAVALALGGPRDVSSAPSESPTLLAATEDPSPTPTPSPQPSPTLTPSPTPSATATPTDEPTRSATPSPTAAPTATPSRSPEPTPQDRSWMALPPMPNAPAYFVRDVVTLADGRLAVFRYERTGSQRASVLTIESGDERWTPVDLDEPLDDFTLWIWTQGPDGLLYSHARVIDPSGTSWDVEPWDPGFDEEPVAPIATGRDGRLIYREAEHLAELLFVDPETGDWQRSSENTIIGNVDAIHVGADLLYLVETEAVASYDPATDSWAALTTMPYVNAARSGIDPDERLIFLDGWESRNQQIFVFDPATGAWSELPRPLAASPTWNPIFRTGPDGRLWAVDAEQSFIYLGD